MKVNRKWIALVLSLLLMTIAVAHVSGDRAKLITNRAVAIASEAILDERSLPLFSQNGKYGFISSVTTGAVISFSATGKVLSTIVVGETAGAISLLETGNHRLIAVPAANDPDQDRPATVTIVDATKPKSLEITTLTVFPKAAHFTPATRAMLTADGRFGIIASSFNEPTLYSFSTETGQIISQFALMGQPSEMTMQNSGVKSVIAVASAAANILSLLSIDGAGNFISLSNFSPANARFGEANNPALSADGRIAYIAAATGERLFAVDVVSGNPLSSLKVAPMPQRLTTRRNLHHDEVIAITCVAASGHSGGVLIATSRGGQLVSKAMFEPPQPIEFAAANNVAFNEEATVGFVAAKSGMLFAFSAETGEMQSFQQLGGELMSLTLNANARKIAVVKRTPSRDEIVITDFEVAGDDIENSPIADDGTLGGTPDARRQTNAGEVAGVLGGSQQAATTDAKAEVATKLNLKATTMGGQGNLLLSNGEGKQIMIEPSRVRLRAGKTLEIDLGDKIDELLAQTGWQFPTANEQVEKPVLEKPEISRASIKRAKNEDGMMRLQLQGKHLSAGATVEIVKAGAVVDRQPLTSVEDEGASLRMPESQYLSLGRFQVRVVNDHKISSNLIEAESLKKPLGDNADAQLANPAAAYALNASATIGAVNARSLGNGVEVVVNLNAKSPYSDFKLSNPSRIVVDVMGVKNAVTSKVLAVRSPSISRVRMGQPAAGVMRVVLDAKGTVPYNVKRNGNQLVITAGEAALVAAK